MALYRQIGGISGARQSPVVWNDTYLPDHVFTAVGDCLRSGYLNGRGIARRHYKTPQESAAGQIVNEYFRAPGGSVSGFFDKLLGGIAAVSMALPRNAFLGIVAINGFGYASKLSRALEIPEARDKMASIWEHLGGKFSVLQDTVKSGAKKKALLKISNGKFVSGASGVGIVPVVAAALIAAATSVIAALLPVISKILDKNKANVTYPGIDPITGLPTDGSVPGTGGAMDLLRDPVVIAAALALAVYYFMD